MLAATTLEGMFLMALPGLVFISIAVWLISLFVR